MSAPVASPTSDLDARYGRTPMRRKWNRRGIWVAAAAFVAVFGAWVVWGGFSGTADEIDTVDVGHLVLDDASVRVEFQVTLDPGDAAHCALEAQNEAHGIVGWKIVDIPASDIRTRSFTEVVRATEQPVTGLIYRCWPA